jgi:hypothetical protein
MRIDSRAMAEGRFLGSDSRTVEQIVAHDAATLASLGTTCQQMAEVLEKAFLAVRAGLGTSVSLSPTLTGIFHDAMGRVPSPFLGDGVFEKGEAVIVDQATGERLVVTRLSIHLIRAHGFFQGRNSIYRVEPSVAAAMLIAVR